MLMCLNGTWVKLIIKQRKTSKTQLNSFFCNIVTKTQIPALNYIIHTPAPFPTSFSATFSGILNYDGYQKKHRPNIKAWSLISEPDNFHNWRLAVIPISLSWNQNLRSAESRVMQHKGSLQILLRGNLFPGRMEEICTSTAEARE